MAGPGRQTGLGRVTRWLAAVCAAAAAFMPVPAGQGADFDVDLALVLAIDCSFSVDAREFRLQMQGLGQAFMRPEVKKAIAQGHRQRIAVAAIQWSDDNNQAVVVPWTVIAGDADADELGQMLSVMPRRLAQGGTSISAALMFSAVLFEKAPTAERRVIDVSSDGRNNSGTSVQPVRDRLIGQGITINGLTIINEWPTLQIYFENNVVGGPSNFVLPANDYEAYGDAIFMKLLREITGPGIS
jgi:hypothetical protein